MVTIKVAVLLSDLTGKNYTESDITQAIARHDPDEFQSSASKLSLVLSNGSLADRSLQRGLAACLLPQDFVDKIEQLERSRRQERVLFFPRQALLLLRWSLIQSGIASQKKTGVAPFNMYSLGLIALIANDLCLKHINANQGGFRQFLQELEIRELSFNAEEQSRYLWPRAYHMFLVMPESYDFARTFEGITGVDLKTHFQAGLAAWRFWRCFTFKNTMEEETPQPYMQIDSYFTGLKLDIPSAKKVLKRISTTPPELSQDFLRTSTASEFNSFDFLPLRRRPLIEMADGILQCPNTVFLEERLTRGIWTCPPELGPPGV